MRLLVPGAYSALLADRLADDRVGGYEDRADLLAAAPKADVLWLDNQTGEDIEATVGAARSVRWIFTTGVGMEHHPLTVYRERGIAVTNGSGLRSVPIAEHTVMLMLAACRGLPEFVRAQGRREWRRPLPPTRLLKGGRALIIGFGSIGRTIGERLRAFGMEVTGVRRRPQGEAGVIGTADWRERLDEFDWVILAAPLTDKTRLMFGGAELGGMRKDAWVVNISRGGLIDQVALLEALKAGLLGGACLDVMDQEPLPESNELWRLPNVLISPHSSAVGAPNQEDVEIERFLENLSLFRSGQPPGNLIDPELGY